MACRRLSPSSWEDNPRPMGAALRYRRVGGHRPCTCTAHGCEMTHRAAVSSSGLMGLQVWSLNDDGSHADLTDSGQTIGMNNGEEFRNFSLIRWRENSFTDDAAPRSIRREIYPWSREQPTPAAGEQSHFRGAGFTGRDCDVKNEKNVTSPGKTTDNAGVATRWRRPAAWRRPDQEAEKPHALGNRPSSPRRASAMEITAEEAEAVKAADEAAAEEEEAAEAAEEAEEAAEVLLRLWRLLLAGRAKSSWARQHTQRSRRRWGPRDCCCRPAPQESEAQVARARQAAQCRAVTAHWRLWCVQPCAATVSWTARPCEHRASRRKTFARKNRACVSDPWSHLKRSESPCSQCSP